MSSVGQPLPRLDGRRKVTGAAQYTGDVPFRGALHGSIVHSVIANGRTISIDTSIAEGAPGVVAVFTYRNMPRMKPVPKPWSHLHPYGQGYVPLQDDRIHYAGQPLALMLANTLDEAAYAGTLVKVEYEARPPAAWSKSSACTGRPIDITIRWSRT
jgi:xanthine dehydrogenase YagR molybdenum-binding subunit